MRKQAGHTERLIDAAQLAYKSWATMHKTEPNETRQLKKYQTPTGIQLKVSYDNDD